MIDKLIEWWEHWLEQGRRNRIERLEVIKRAKDGCVFCGDYGGEVKELISHTWISGVYSSWHPTYKYHVSCLKKVLESPEHNGHKKVDYALKITQEISYWKKQIEKGRRVLEEEESAMCYSGRITKDG